MHIPYILAFVLTVLSLPVIAQFDGQETSRHRLGISIGHGSQAALDVTYLYKVRLFIFQYSYMLVENSKASLEVIVQPQFNETTYRLSDISSVDPKTGFEAGINTGLLARKTLISNRLSAMVILSVGPHFISGAPRRQADGFLFSDNLVFGFNFQTDFNLHFDIRAGFRHLSNAGLKTPNAGINNLHASLGAFYSI